MGIASFSLPVINIHPKAFGKNSKLAFNLYKCSKLPCQLNYSKIAPVTIKMSQLKHICKNTSQQTWDGFSRQKAASVKNDNHWIGIKLVGGPKSPRDAIGAKVFLTSDGVRQRADVFSGGSYGSSSDQRLHFGLGQVMKVDKIEIHWPSGTKEAFAGSSTDRIITAVEGKGFTDK